MTRRTKRARRLGASDDDDPLQGVANLFDLGIILALGFMLALLGHLDAASMAIHDSAVQLTHFRTSDQTVGGDGARLGMAYRLKTGEVVYVPEGAKK